MGRVDFVGSGGSSLFVISWVWVDFMVRLFDKCEFGLISWVWVMVVRQVLLILGFNFGRCDMILMGSVV